MDINHRAHLRIARPVRDPAATARFWIDGLGMTELYRYAGTGTVGDHAVIMIGWPDADWHLEFVAAADAQVEPAPTPEDLVVLYLDGDVPESIVANIEKHGGERVPAHNPYWDKWGVTLQDPDGYRLVLSTRSWSND